ncbi:DivIVA domain-containing protein [Fibrivirga algicola]|uniref:DivIVA domain-containing protein n=1 Tax=Fibrivirga algicola TaxID=2950420 RepID=A0ABX0QIP1_9BACT|nr:DivIVA domain-containing protein [Fibrivirga algicola]ARK12710.1 cell division protein DivIVA [Fibrella sp. ES10-3-2-2]NID12124.1 DivIVA domain-containing protein [Fibrivirga algicola]
MKITPIEIRQHTFEKSLRGYKVDDVDAFLSSLSQEWERVVGESKMLKMQLELAEKELNKLKEIELTLFRTLKNAEDNSSHIAEQANRQAEQYIAEMRQKADEQLAVAKKKSAVMIQDAENQARYVRENLSVELKSLEQDFKAMERYKDNLMVQIRALATNAMDSVDRFEKKFARQSAKQKFDEVGGEPVNAETPVAELPAPEEAQPVEAPMLETETATGSDVVNEEPDQATEAEQEVQPVTVSAPELPANAEVPDDLPTNVQSTDEPNPLAGADASAQYGASATVNEPQVTQVERDEKKGGGSFFDQI